MPTCFGSLGWFKQIKRRCPECDWRLYEACNHVRFCMYCEWHEPDPVRIQRLAAVA